MHARFFSIHAKKREQTRPLPGMITKDLRNDIISCELMYKNANGKAS